MDLLQTIQTFAQNCVAKTPVIVLGSGASVVHGIPGMWALGQQLKHSTLPLGLTTADTDGWHAFCKRLDETDLESALTDVTVTAVITQHIISTTWEFLNAADVKLFEDIVSDRQLLPLTKLFRHLFRSTATEIQIVTPNYDRVAEYAAEAAGYSAFTGFTFGMLGQRANAPIPKIFYGRNPSRTVNVWKVHGSFGWFHDQNNIVVSLPPTLKIPTGMTPVIVTPGIEKYRRTHDEPFRTTMQSADAAIRSASAFLCIGYGFNDSHLQPLLVERCDTDSAPLVLITKEISAKAHDFFRSGKCHSYLALEETSVGTRLFSNDYPDGAELPGFSYWKLSDFLSLIM
jgi:hypothetical protein